ncbi:hypothetical protein EDD16DRAFT_1591806 [Pisolithus croceorrhizus]|nr:hypothetical protein EDD16DRAFT_1591806 [Pisolithus croceorrhizus]
MGYRIRGERVVAVRRFCGGVFVSIINVVSSDSPASHSGNAPWLSLRLCGLFHLCQCLTLFNSAWKTQIRRVSS